MFESFYYGLYYFTNQTKQDWKTTRRWASPTKLAHLNLRVCKKYWLIGESVLTIWNLEKLVHLSLWVQKKYWLITESLTLRSLAKLAHLNLRVQEKYPLISESCFYNLEPREATASKSESPKKYPLISESVTYKCETRDASTPLSLKSEIWESKKVSFNQWISYWQMWK